MNEREMHIFKKHLDGRVLTTLAGTWLVENEDTSGCIELYPVDPHTLEPLEGRVDGEVVTVFATPFYDGHPGLPVEVVYGGETLFVESGYMFDGEPVSRLLVDWESEVTRILDELHCEGDLVQVRPSPRPDLEEVTRKAMTAFWNCVAENHPKVSSGDCPPDVAEEFERVARGAVEVWQFHNC